MDDAHHSASGNRAVSAGLAAGGALSFGATVALSRALARAQLPPSGVLGIRFATAALVLWALLWLLRAPLLPAPGERVATFGLGAVVYSIEATFFYLALQHGSAAAVTLLFYSYPALVTVTEALTGARKVGRRTLGALALSTSGAALVIASRDHLTISGAGVAFALCAALTFGGYLMAGDRLTRRSDPRAVGALVAAGVAVTQLLYAFGSSSFDVPARYLGIVLANGVATASAFALVFAALRRLRAADTAVILTLEAFWAGLLSWVFLGESIRPMQAVGGVAVLAAVAIIAISSEKGTTGASEIGVVDTP
ncbi:MAG: DMT family transporter [Actinomycetota bacterium]